MVWVSLRLYILPTTTKNWKHSQSYRTTASSCFAKICSTWFAGKWVVEADPGWHFLVCFMGTGRQRLPLGNLLNAAQMSSDEFENAAVSASFEIIPVLLVDTIRVRLINQYYLVRLFCAVVDVFLRKDLIPPCEHTALECVICWNCLF